MGDLVNLIHSDTAIMKIRDHDGRVMEGVDGEMGIEFFGPDTKEQRTAYRGHRRALMEADEDSEKELEAECQFLAEVTKRFHNVTFMDQELTVKDAPRLYRDVIAVRAQASLFVGKDANFIKGRGEN